MNFIQNYFQKRNNNIVANLDYELAEQFMNADFKFVEKDLDKNGQYDGKLIGKKFFHLEGIFLFLTDRTLSHPQVPYHHEDRGGKFGNILKEMGFGNRKVIWQPSDLFDLDIEPDQHPAVIDLIFFDRTDELNVLVTLD